MTDFDVRFKKVYDTIQRHPFDPSNEKYHYYEDLLDYLDHNFSSPEDVWEYRPPKDEYDFHQICSNLLSRGRIVDPFDGEDGEGVVGEDGEWVPEYDPTVSDDDPDDPFDEIYESLEPGDSIKISSSGHSMKMEIVDVIDVTEVTDLT